MLRLPKSTIVNLVVLTAALIGVVCLVVILYRIFLNTSVNLSYWSNPFTPGSTVWLHHNNGNIKQTHILERITGFVASAEVGETNLKLKLIEKGDIQPFLAGETVSDAEFIQLSNDKSYSTLEMILPLEFPANSITGYESFSKGTGYQRLLPGDLESSSFLRKYVILEVARNLAGDVIYISNLVITTHL